MKIKYFLIFGLLLFSPFFVSAATADHLVISQVQITGGKGKTGNDFIELHNPTDQAVSLTNWKLVKRTKTGATDSSLVSWNSTDSAAVPAYGYYLWANGDYLDIPVTPDITRKSTIAEDNGIALKDSGGNVIDSVGWGGASNIFVEGAAFVSFDGGKVQSLERKPGGIGGNGQDSNSNSDDFFIQAAPHPRNSLGQEGLIAADPQSEPDAPVSAPVRQYTQSLIISEFLPNPEGADTGEEWVELFNPSNEIVELAGWKLDDKPLSEDAVGVTAYKFPDTAKLMPGEFLTVDLPEDVFGLSNFGGDTLRLIWPDDTVAAKVVYEGDAPEEQAYARKADGSYAWTLEQTKNTANRIENGLPLNPSVLGLSTPNGDVFVRIKAALPNPKGADSGKEWILLENFGDFSLDLDGWILDDGKVEDKIGSSAFTLGPLGLNPKSEVTVTIPEGKVTFANTGEDHIRLFNPQKILINEVGYIGAAEGKVLSFAPASGAEPATPTSEIIPPAELQKTDLVVAAPVAKEPAAEQGSVAGAKNLPRTGTGSALYVCIFVFFGLFWYIFRVSRII
ncbi:MAG: lamin tail domain-containing protein [Candidatus Saccharibacteria bacterium]